MFGLTGLTLAFVAEKTEQDEIVIIKRKDNPELFEKYFLWYGPVCGVLFSCVLFDHKGHEGSTKVGVDG